METNKFILSYIYANPQVDITSIHVEQLPDILEQYKDYVLSNTIKPYWKVRYIPTGEFLLKWGTSKKGGRKFNELRHLKTHIRGMARYAQIPNDYEVVEFRYKQEIVTPLSNFLK